jgi:hypothetical protein
MRLSEFVDFLNREVMPMEDIYTHLTIDKTTVKSRRKYRIKLRKEKRHEHDRNT